MAKEIGIKSVQIDARMAIELDGQSPEIWGSLDNRLERSTEQALIMQRYVKENQRWERQKQ